MSLQPTSLFAYGSAVISASAAAASLSSSISPTALSNAALEDSKYQMHTPHSQSDSHSHSQSHSQSLSTLTPTSTSTSTSAPLTGSAHLITLSPPQLAPYLFSLSSIPPPACLSNAVASLDEESAPSSRSLSGGMSMGMGMGVDIPLRNGSTARPTEIRLNVGGLLYMTSIQTLLNPAFGHTYFTAMFHGPWRESQIIHNAAAAHCHSTASSSSCSSSSSSSDMKQIFIDRDGQLFGYILNFLRDGFFPFLHYLSPSSLPFLSLLFHEAAFYQIDSLQKILQQSIEKLEGEKEKQREKEKENEWRMEFILQQKENDRRKAVEQERLSQQTQSRRNRLSAHRHSFGNTQHTNAQTMAMTAFSSSSSMSSAPCGKKCACQRCQPALYSFNYHESGAATARGAGDMDSDESLYSEQENHRRTHSISPLVPKQTNFIFTTNEAF